MVKSLVSRVVFLFSSKRKHEQDIGDYNQRLDKYLNAQKTAKEILSSYRDPKVLAKQRKNVQKQTFLKNLRNGTLTTEQIEELNEISPNFWRKYAKNNASSASGVGAQSKMDTKRISQKIKLIKNRQLRIRYTRMMKTKVEELKRMKNSQSESNN